MSNGAYAGLTSSFKRDFRLIAFSRLIQEIIFWYSIFIAFAYSIHLSLEQISLSIVAVNLGVILFEVPSGVLADRWSRKWTLLIATAVLMLSSLIIGLSKGPVLYIIGSFLWGVFFAVQSGTSESLIYDMLKKEDKTNLYKKYIGRYMMLGTVGLIIGSISGSIIADVISLRSAYLLSLIPCALSLPLLVLANEPKEHQKSQEFSAYAHYGLAFRQLIKQKALMLMVLASVLIVASVSFIFELNQVYYYAAALPLALYGIANSSLQFSVGGGVWLAGLASNKKSIAGAVALLVTISVAIVLSISIISALLLSLMLLMLYYLETALGHYIQDQLGSEVRSAATSMVSTGGRLVFTPMILLFGALNTSKETVNGFVILVVVLAVLGCLVYVSLATLDNFDRVQRSKL